MDKHNRLRGGTENNKLTGHLACGSQALIATLLLILRCQGQRDLGQCERKGERARRELRKRGRAARARRELRKRARVVRAERDQGELCSA